MKRFLLVAGDQYYPGAGTKNWIGCFESCEAAAEKVQFDKEFSNFIINGQSYDWYEIIDLNKWIN